ncbi:hypothetical protein [Paenibacillus sp. J2TS4]|uniref:hypothetical protein n=1 Tax=Paenibacillus sp. J2TS4 TaxID=2807194 RepID=UPI001B0B7E0A|nr:hypothetical protein [Paenibacillus sp. J2TS4]GIP34848.1 hypothetical protein J2TS4_40580 [Paenibacillus sp. J2TS4]
MSTKKNKLVPWLAALLLLSVGFNIYFISHTVKQRQQAELDWGKKLILGYYDASVFAGIMRDATGSLLDNPGVEQRLSYKYQIGLAYRFNQAIPLLIAGAEKINGKPFKPMKYIPAHWFTEINNALGTIGSDGASLTEEELSYVKTAHELFSQTAQLLEGFEVESTADDLALAMAQGGAWVSIVEQINDLFAEAPEFLFTYRSTLGSK